MLCLLHCSTETILLTEGRKYSPRRSYVGQSWSETCSFNPQLAGDMLLAETFGEMRYFNPLSGTSEVLRRSNFHKLWTVYLWRRNYISK